MNRTEHLSDSVTLHLGDCRDVCAAFPRAAAVVTDPPYGMEWDADHTRFSGGQGGQKRRSWAAVENDNRPFDPSPWLAFDEAILFGCNHFGQSLPVGTTLIWLKRTDSGLGSFLSDAELAWMKGGHGVYCMRDMSLQGESARRVHPTQKPVDLMKWCIQKTKAGIIIDPFAGSGTTGIAAVSLGRWFIGCEIEPKYFDIAARRIADALARPDMFVEKPARAGPADALELPLNATGR